jgi:hypothetical protein
LAGPVDIQAMVHVPNRFADWGKATVAGVDAPQPAASVAPVAPQSSSALRSPRAVAALVVAGVAIGLLLATIVGGPKATAVDTTALTSGSFKTAYPGGFRLSVSHPVSGATVYQLTSPSTTAVVPFIHGPPPAGVIAIDITDVSVALVASLDHDPAALTQTPLQMLPSTVDQPAGATGVVNSVPIHATSLDGVAAAAAGYSYTYQGLANVQADVLARNAQELDGIELDTEPSLAAQGEAALGTILAHWSWTNSAAVAKPGASVTS